MSALRPKILGAVVLAALIGVVGIITLKNGSPLKSAGPLTIVYPRTDALFPVDIVAPTFRWTDQGRATQWRITIAFSGGSEAVTVVTDTRQWRPQRDLWESIKQRTLRNKATFTVSGIGLEPAGESIATDWITFATSPDPVAAPIFFRAASIPFGKKGRDETQYLKSMRWCLGNVSSDSPPRTVMEGVNLCVNCHSFSNSGKVLGMDVDHRGDKGGYAISAINEKIVIDSDKIISWNDLKSKDGVKSTGLLAQLSPDGRHAVATVEENLIGLVRMDNLSYSQNFFPIGGHIRLYDLQSGRFSRLAGADNPAYAQTNPVWTPDGKFLVFARAPAIRMSFPEDANRKEITREEKKRWATDLWSSFDKGRRYRYDLFRVPFNNGDGGTPEPVPGASFNGKSNFFPKFSPDGKWMVFCQADSYFLLQPDSLLYIVPSQGGMARRMNCNMEGTMNSWHSWSPNGRWMVFSSKVNGPYTQLWLTHIDNEGNDTPPLLLEHLSVPERAANIPEFLNLPHDYRMTIELQE
jgi:hypothetical protein